MDRVKVVLEGIEVPQSVVAGISISYGFNSLSQAQIALGGDVGTPGVFSSEKAYEKLSSLLLKGYPDVKIFVDGELLFEGFVTGISFNRGATSSSVMLTAASHFMLLDLYRIFLFNVANIQELAIHLRQAKTYPMIENLSSETKLMLDKIEKMMKAITEEKYRDKDPIRIIAEEIFKVKEEFLKEYKHAEWVKKYVEILKPHEYVDSYPPNSRHLIRLFAKTFKNVDLILYRFIFGQAIKEPSKFETALQMFLRLVNMFQLYVLEVPTAKGLSIVVKPMMLFHHPPRSNLIPSHQLIEFSVSEETGTAKPTRTYLFPYQPLDVLVENSNPIVYGMSYLQRIVAAPEELEKKALFQVAEKIGMNVESLKERPIEDLAREIFDRIKKEGISDGSVIKEYHKILTKEEEGRGIVLNTYDLPPSFSAILEFSDFTTWLILKELAQNVHYTTRASYSNALIVFNFNPYVLPGHTMIFSDGNHRYFGFVTNVSHKISPSGMVTSASLMNFSRVDPDSKDVFVEYQSIFEFVENGDYMQTMDEEFLSKYYREMFGTEMGKIEDLDKLESLSGLDYHERIQEVYNFWYRPISTQGKEIKIDKQIQDMVREFIESLSYSIW